MSRAEKVGMVIMISAMPVAALWGWPGLALALGGGAVLLVSLIVQ